MTFRTFQSKRGKQKTKCNSPERDREKTLENETEKEFPQLGHQDVLPGEEDPECSALTQRFSS